MRRAVTALLTAVAAVVAVLAGLPAHATSWTPSSYSSRLLTLVNNARAQDGLPALQLAAGTTTVAAGWTQHLASTRTLAHNPDLRHQLETHGSADWTTYGENVGNGGSGDPDRLFRAYWASTEHRDNILTRAFRYVGVATVFTGGTAWNTFDFVDEYAGGRSSGSAGSQTSGGHVDRLPARPAPAPTHVATPATPPAPVTTRPIARPAKHPAPARPRVRALRNGGTPTSHPARLPSTATAAVPAATLVTAASPFDVSTATDMGRGRAVAVALAMLALAAAARRWVLVAASRHPAAMPTRP